jgi:hypothetical protein
MISRLLLELINATTKNLPVSLDDIKIVKKIDARKDKTTRQKHARIVADCIEIPKELIMAHANVTLGMNGMKVYSIPFLTTKYVYCKK